MSHHCHALGCKASCPPEWLMCSKCWAQVPRDLQAEVARTCKLRNPEFADETWGPWYRVQAYAIHHVAMLREPSSKGAKWLARELAAADRLGRPAK